MKLTESMISPKFYKIFESFGHFHDWGVTELSCRSCPNKRLSKSDIVRFTLCDDILPVNGNENFKELFYVLEFRDVSSFCLKPYHIPKEKVWNLYQEPIEKTGTFELGRIVSSNIHTDTGENIFELTTDNCHEIIIVFKSVKVSKMIGK